METLVLYYHGIPMVVTALDKSPFSIGAHLSCDLKLATPKAAPVELCLVKGSDGVWRALPQKSARKHFETALEPGTRIAFQDFGVELCRDTAHSMKGSEVGNKSDNPSPRLFGLVGTSMFVRVLKMDIARYGCLLAPLLITGETGTGKELIARGLHAASPRVESPFVAVNCGGLTESLLEDTLFGHERGAFTGALTAKRGLFEQARNGTLFLDEIGELGLKEQASLLRVLEDRSVMRLGSEKPIDVDFRLVAATNRDLRSLVERKLFRLDLYHRISALRIPVLPLRKRTEDVEPLALYFLSEFESEIGKRKMSKVALEHLQGQPWPGNVRELRNALYRAAAASSREMLEAEDFDFRDIEQRIERRSFRLEDVPDAVLGDLLTKHQGNVAAAARELGVPRTSLRDRLRRPSPLKDQRDSLDNLPISLAS